MQVNRTKLAVPPAFRERCAVRITEAKFGVNKNGNPMITVDAELVGFFDAKNQIQTKVTRGGIDYQLAGLRLPTTYFTLTDKAVDFYADFYEAAKGEPLTIVDENNPDIEYMKGLVMQALISGTSEPQRKILSEGDKAALKAEGKPLQGEPLLDDNGNEITRNTLKVNQWLKPYTGELPPF